MNEIQISAEGISIDELLENLSPYAQDGTLTFTKSISRGSTLLYEIIFALTTNIGASYLYDALKNLVRKKPTTQIKILLTDDVVEIDIDSLKDQSLFIDRQKEITAIKIVNHG